MALILRPQLLLSVTASLIWFAKPSAASFYFENGDFQRPVPKPGSLVVIDTGERYGTWRVVGAAGNVIWTSGSYQHGGFSFPVVGNPKNADKFSWVNLAGISQSATGIAHRPVPTTIGATYVLTFSVGNIVDPGGSYGTSSAVTVYENSRVIGHATNGGGAGTKTENWKAFSISFVADAAWTTIAFINADAPGDMNCGIDAIDLVASASAKVSGDRR